MAIDSRDYKMALATQSACNLSGIVHEFSHVISKIFREANEKGEGTDWVNSHPICRLYAEQIVHLTRGRKWDDALKACEEHVSREEAARLAGSQNTRKEG